MELTKPCEECGKTIVKPPSCSRAAWPKRRFCSTACKQNSQIGQIPWNKGQTFESHKQYVPCRICGDPTRYPGGPYSPIIDMVSCDKPACRSASRALKNQRIRARALEMYASGERQARRDAWNHVNLVSSEESMLAEWFVALGWVPQHRVVPSTNQRSFRLDFADPNRRLNVEIDGTSHRHNARRERDARRDATLTTQGWRILRIPAQDVRTDIETVRTKILDWITAQHLQLL